MSAQAVGFSRTWKVGRYTAELSVPALRSGQPVHAVIEWSPDVPRRLTASETQDYLAGRTQALAELAAQFELRVAVVDV